MNNILVIGDVMLDNNYYSTISRYAPEAPIPIHKIINTEYILGGAANVAKNIHNLTNNVELISIIGDDYFGKIIQKLLNDSNINNKLFLDNRHTTQKNRIFYENKIINRFDIEDTFDIDSIIEDTILNYIKTKNNIKAIILSDYDKGFLTFNLCKNIINYANINNIYVFIDPKINNELKYKNCFCIKPNLLEAQILSKETDINKIFTTIYNKINPSNVIITMGDKGSYINSETIYIPNPTNIKVVDVTGAGDIFISVLTYLFLINNDILLSSKIANFIASKSVQYIGNYNITLTDIDEYYLNENIIIYDHDINKIKLLNKLYSNIVFTNGCFDIFHSTHLKLLNFCKKENYILVVGLNSDSSIQKIKGPYRPINNLTERCELLKNLNIIDFIIIFDNDSPYNILSYLKPSIIVKGGDYNIDNIIGKEFAQEILLFDYINGVSSTKIINNVINKHDNI